MLCFFNLHIAHTPYAGGKLENKRFIAQTHLLRFTTNSKFMNYQETIQYLFNSAPLFQQVGGAAYKEGLSNTEALDQHFGHPHRKFKTIHIAGTNGKGSTAHTLACILQHKGLKVGLYTSPHLVDFRERIRINGEMVSKQFVVDFVAHHRDFFEPLHPSFFELTTAMAFHYFALQHVDVAVIEVGLGGRLDCTNIIRPELSVITNISFDHTQFLGHTLAAIASEKAGIIKPGIPVVIGETTPETRPVFAAKAHDCGSPILFANEGEGEILNTYITEEGLRHYDTAHWGSFDSQLPGECQTKNAATILCAAKVLQPIFSFTADDVRYAFRHVCTDTGLMGRWQTIRKKPIVVCDTGHNVGGWNYLGHQLKKAVEKYRQVHIVFGMAADKDVDHVLQLLPENAQFYWTRASVHRALDETKLEKMASQHGLKGMCFHAVPEAYQAALSHAADDDFIYVGGSSFIVADLMASIK